MNRVLLIRADASAAIGTGHVMRCLALAQAWCRDGANVLFAQAETTSTLEKRLRVENFELVPVREERGSTEDAAETVALAQARGATWIVADGYCFGAAWQKQIRAAGLRLLVIDDYGQAEHYHADLVLNQNLSASESLYARRDADTRLLLGPRYALLRREFLDASISAREIADTARKVLVTLGGSDPDQVTAKVVMALREIPGLEAIVVVGGSNPHLESLSALIGSENPALRLIVDATNMSELMRWADVAVTAAGSTSWELATAGLPALQLVIADNQAPIADALYRAGVTVSLGDHRASTPAVIAEALRELLAECTQRREMSSRGRRLVDGRGANRVAAALGARLRLTLASDAGSWINDFLLELKSGFEAQGHEVRWVHNPAEVECGDAAFFLSLSKIVPPEILRRNAHNLVVHESALPQGRGWSPLTWQILEGKSEVPVSLIEAASHVDAGEIYAQRVLRFDGSELVGELRTAQAQATSELCGEFVARYPFICAQGRPQVGEPSYYPRRGPADSRLDPDKSIREQFNLLRVADPERYPAFFELGGQRYQIRLSIS
jgi:UDP-2,4-diacetamido-2,4,6-trideoxy-beta-L-altropyranose hydrolase